MVKTNSSRPVAWKSLQHVLVLHFECENGRWTEHSRWFCLSKVQKYRNKWYLFFRIITAVLAERKSEQKSNCFQESMNIFLLGFQFRRTKITVVNIVFSSQFQNIRSTCFDFLHIRRGRLLLNIWKSTISLFRWPVLLDCNSWSKFSSRFERFSYRYWASLIIHYTLWDIPNITRTTNNKTWTGHRR